MMLPKQDSVAKDSQSDAEGTISTVGTRKYHPENRYYVSQKFVKESAR